MSEIYEKLIIEAMKEVIRSNRRPDKTLTEPNREILDGNGQITPYYIAAQAKQIADHMMTQCFDLESKA